MTRLDHTADLLMVPGEPWHRLRQRQVPNAASKKPEPVIQRTAEDIIVHLTSQMCVLMSVCVFNSTSARAIPNSPGNPSTSLQELVTPTIHFTQAERFMRLRMEARSRPSFISDARTTPQIKINAALDCR